MKKISHSIPYLSIAAAILVASSAWSQGLPSVTARGSGSRQWMSHQMNQPGPDEPKRFTLSKKLLEEIRRLYMEAKKEHESKAGRKSRGR